MQNQRIPKFEAKCVLSVAEQSSRRCLFIYNLYIMISEVNWNSEISLFLIGICFKG